MVPCWEYFFVNLQSFEGHDFALVKIHRDLVVVVEKNFPMNRSRFAVELDSLFYYTSNSFYRYIVR